MKKNTFFFSRSNRRDRGIRGSHHSYNNDHPIYTQGERDWGGERDTSWERETRVGRERLRERERKVGEREKTHKKKNPKQQQKTQATFFLPHPPFRSKTKQDKTKQTHHCDNKKRTQHDPIKRREIERKREREALVLCFVVIKSLSLSCFFSFSQILSLSLSFFFLLLQVDTNCRIKL